MPIELRCHNCEKLLRVGDEAAGKKARCPNCGTISRVPDADELPHALPPANPTPPTATSANAQGSPPLQSPTTSVSGWGEPGDNPFADKAESNPYASPTVASVGMGDARRPYRRPHRGGTILTFGILGLLCCGFLGIAAWVMGASDLAEMRRGVMDSSGRSMTKAGMILGIVATALMALSFVLQMLAVIVG